MTASILTVVIGTYNRLDQLKRAVDSVIAQTATPLQLIVADAGSTDGTVEYLESVRSETVVPILAGKKLGQAKALNDAFREVVSPYSCWLSDDNEVVKHGLDTAVAVLDQDSRIGMVGLKVRDLEGPFVDAPYIGGMSAFGILNVNQGVLRTQLLKQVGYFSEEFRDYGIDPDLTAKVLLAGKDIVYTRDVAIHHYRNWEMDKTSKAYADQQARQQKYLAKYAELYSSKFPPTLVWLGKKVIWRLASRGMKINVNSPGRFLGLGLRDWHNCLTGRYISVMRELTAGGGLYHLRQRGRS